MTERRANIFSSVEQSTSFKRHLNGFKVFEVGFSDLNTHLIDSYFVDQHKSENRLKYLLFKTGWVISKLFGKRLKNTINNVLFIPAEMDKDRSIGLFKPVFPFLQKQYDVTSVDKLLSSVNFSIFFKWLFKTPVIIRAAVSALNNNKAPTVLKEIKWMLVIDSVVHYLWIMQFRSYFKGSSYKSVVVDWDRHKFQSLMVLAAKLEGIKTYTFVHGAIYTPEKFVPLVAEKCFAWGNDHVKFFTALGEERISILKTGNTRFNRILPDRQTVLNKYSISSSKKIILHPSQNFPDLDDAVVIKDLHRFISGNDNYQLAVKFHPSQDNRALINKLSGLEGIILLDKSIAAGEALSIASFAIIVSSTFSIDALIAGVPVAIYKPSPALRGIAVDLVNKAQVPLLENENDVAGLMNNVMNQPAEICFNMPAQRSFINNYCEYYGDESAKVIAGILN